MAAKKPSPSPKASEPKEQPKQQPIIIQNPVNTIYVDGIASISCSDGVVKFLLYKNDPAGADARQNIAREEIAMPLKGFIAAQETQATLIQTLVDNGVIRKQDDAADSK